jgi:hypothetical protein
MPGGPVPPDMHWIVLLVLAWITFGLAGLIWVFKQAAFVKRLDPASNAVMLWLGAIVAMVLQTVIFLVVVGAGSTRSSEAALLVIMLLNVVVIVFGLMAVFGMRSSLVRYYNSVEPIGLRLSGVMTFFFNVLYFQYHFSRIAAWKKTGQLR